MKKTIVFLVLISLIGCASPIYVEDEVVGPYGMYHLFFDKDKINEDMVYKLSIGNMILSVVLVETIVVPFVLVGWYLWQPIPNY